MKKYYYVAHIFYFPLSHAISLINNGHSVDDARKIALDKFAYTSRGKRNKDFNITQFNRHLDKFVSIPGAILVRKSKRR